MATISGGSLSFIFLVFVLGGLVKGVTGMGLPTVAMGLLATLLPPAAAASLLLLPSLLTNVWQLAAGPSPRSAALRFWPMMAGVVVGAFLAAGALAGAGAHEATFWLGAALALYAAYGLIGRRLSIEPAAERWLAAPVGLATGAVTGATGVFVMPAVPYLQALGLEREELVQALGLSFTVSTLALGGGLALAGGADEGALLYSALALVPAAIGMAIGQSLRQHIPQAIFQKVFFLGLLALGVYLCGA